MDDLDDLVAEAVKICHIQSNHPFLSPLQEIYMFEWIKTNHGVVEVFINSSGVVFNTFDWSIVGVR